MPIYASDIKLRKSQVMADVPEGGGGPSAEVIEFGQSNTIFDDVSTLARTSGEVSIRQVHMHVDTPNTDRLLGAYAIVSKLPEDDNVSVVLAECSPFAKRTEIAQSIANYLIRGIRWPGFLLENHVANQQNIQIFQRVGTQVPPVGRTLVLVINEGLPTEAIQYVRITDVESEVQTFTDDKGDYQALVVRCELGSGLSQAWAGTAPNRYFNAGAGKTVIRDTTVADAANYYGASRLALAGSLNDTQLKVESIYCRVVPSGRNEVPFLDQRPAAVRTLTLASAPREVLVAAAPHTRRIKVGQENRASTYTGIMTPRPEPGTCVWTWVVLGNRYTAEDNGAGEIVGTNVAGTINYTSGSWSISLSAQPDVGSALVSQWGTRLAYTNRSSQGAQVRMPESVFVLDGGEMESIEPGTLTIGYTSADVVRTATAAADGSISGDGTGFVDHASRTVTFVPSYIPDPGAEYSLDYQTTTLQKEILAPGTPDAGGFITVALAQQPVAGTLRLSWATAQEVATTSGGTVSSTKLNASSTTRAQVAQVPDADYRAFVEGILGVDAFPNWRP